MDISLGLTSLGRDPFSMLSHLFGAIISLGATFVIVRRARRNGMRGLGVGIYGVLMAVAFSASALFHYVDAGSPRYELYNKLDHVAIFLMIAGTGTAIYAALHTRWADRLTGALWAFSLLGIGFKLTFWTMPDWLTSMIYVVVGWLGSLGVVAMRWGGRKRPVHLFVLGGIVFTMGAAVYAVGWPSVGGGLISAHGVFHVLVLLGAALHYAFVFRHCTTPRVARRVRTVA